MWVRGLKLGTDYQQRRQTESHPMWVRGLKPAATSAKYNRRLSHPMWVRGLKLYIIVVLKWACRRTLCGCVD